MLPTCVEEKDAERGERHVGPPPNQIRRPAQEQGPHHHTRHEPAHCGLAPPVLITNLREIQAQYQINAENRGGTQKSQKEPFNRKLWAKLNELREGKAH
jgi:hypothetical protein